MTDQETLQLMVFSLFDEEGFIYFENIHRQYYKEGEDDSEYGSILSTIGIFEQKGFSKRGMNNAKTVSILSEKGKRELWRLKQAQIKNNQKEDIEVLQIKHLKASIKDLSPKRKLLYMVIGFVLGSIASLGAVWSTHILQSSQLENKLRQADSTNQQLTIDKAFLTKQIKDLQYTLKKMEGVTPL